MSLFDAFTPERLIKALGIDPAQLVQFMQRMQGELGGFKTGFASVVAHFNTKLSLQEARLSLIERKQDRILALLGDTTFGTPPAIANGHDKQTGEQTTEAELQQ
jgi:hypothetical protein